MKKIEELALYKKALIDWEKPIEEAKLNKTNWGFCRYFRRTSKFDYHYLETLLNQAIFPLGIYHYEFTGCHPEGRQQRVTALRNTIEILENELKQTENG